MALFDENAIDSEEIAALFRSREILSECTSLQELLEAGTAAIAKQLIIPGPMPPPDNGETYTIDELEGRLAYAQLYPNDDENGLAVIRSKAVGAISEKAGILRLHVRRQVREVEYNVANGRTDLWLHFTDLTSRMMEQFIEAADLNLASAQIIRLGIPKFNHRDDWVAQGKFVFCDFMIAWGGSESAE